MNRLHRRLSRVEAALQVPVPVAIICRLAFAGEPPDPAWPEPWRRLHAAQQASLDWCADAFAPCVPAEPPEVFFELGLVRRLGT